MADFDFEGRWKELSEEVISGMLEWRLQHPKATFREIEGAIGPVRRLGALRESRRDPEGLYGGERCRADRTTPQRRGGSGVCSAAGAGVGADRKGVASTTAWRREVGDQRGRGDGAHGRRG